MDTRTSASAHGQGDAGLDTFPRWLMHHAKVRPQHPAMREKEYGIWQTYTWAQVAENVRAIACGLAANPAKYAAGSPGSSRVSMKVTMTTPTMLGIAVASRDSSRFSIARGRPSAAERPVVDSAEDACAGRGRFPLMATSPS